MKRLALPILLICFAGMSALAQVGVSGPHTKAFVNRLVASTNGASLTVTNSIDYAAYELKRVEYQLADTWTNVLTIAQARNYRLPQTQLSIITTSDVVNPATGSGWVETNSFPYGATYVSFTNSWIAAANETTNQLTVYDSDDFDEGWSWEYEDVQTFSFTYQGAVDLIRIYNVYPRP